VYKRQGIRRARARPGRTCERPGDGEATGTDAGALQQLASRDFPRSEIVRHASLQRAGNPEQRGTYGDPCPVVKMLF